MTEIILQYFDGCPNWETTARYVATLIDGGLDATIDYEVIDSYEKAVQRRFPGSPTVLINGVDPFAKPNAEPGLACRIYDTETGPAGSPTIGQLRKAIARTQKGRTRGDGH
ncbi:MAG: thioredoxin family protein [Actinomycetota bacterium]|nr:thioredoxin family protein [Actinomycetota bacterium]